MSSTALSILPTSLIPQCTHDLQHETARTHLDLLRYSVNERDSGVFVHIYISRLILSSSSCFLLQQRYDQPLRASLHFRFLTDLVSRRSTVQHLSGISDTISFVN